MFYTHTLSFKWLGNKTFSIHGWYSSISKSGIYILFTILNKNRILWIITLESSLTTYIDEWMKNNNKTTETIRGDATRPLRPPTRPRVQDPPDKINQDMSPNSRQDKSSRRMTREAAKIAKVRLPEYQDSSMVTWTRCLLCKGSKRRGFYTKSSLLRHYVKQHEEWICLLIYIRNFARIFSFFELCLHIHQGIKICFSLIEWVILVQLVFFSDTLPKSMRELRANSYYCSFCNFFVSDMTEHQGLYWSHFTSSAY